MAGIIVAQKGAAFFAAQSDSVCAFAPSMSDL